jgi:hypothetical protein
LQLQLLAATTTGCSRTENAPLKRQSEEEHAGGFSEETLPILNIAPAQFNTRLCNKERFICGIY